MIRLMIPLFVLMLPASAWAGPCMQWSLFTNINLGVIDGGAVDPTVEKSVTIRDCFNNPVEGATVVITFTSCQDIRLCAVQPHHPGPLLNCAAKTVSAVTSASGIARFRIAGGATSGPGNPPGAGIGCATMQVDGVPIPNVTVGAYDNDLHNGVNPADISNWLGDRVGFIADPLNYRGRSDFNGSNSIDPADGSMILRVSGLGDSSSSCGSTCL